MKKMFHILIAIFVVFGLLGSLPIVAQAAPQQSSATSFKAPLVTGLPWAPGETWNFTQSFHGGAQNALDFQTTTGKPGRILAADEGNITWAYETCVLITRSDGIALGYQHVVPADIKTLSTRIGQHVNKGDYLGMTAGAGVNGCGGHTDGNVVHFWAQGVAHFEPGSVIGGYTVGGICSTEPALNKDGIKYCPIVKITYTITSPAQTPILPAVPTPIVTTFKNGSSQLYQDQNWGRANLKVCADNLNGNTVNVLFNRDGRSWNYSQKATSNCVTFYDMDGAGPLNLHTTYYSRAALNQSPNSSWSIPCYSATGGKGLCDQIRRP